MNNYSHESQDERPITRVLYEKAAFGAVPVTYKLHNDDRLHPVQFIKHPELGSVQFSDGTTIVVSQPPAPIYKDEADRDPNPQSEVNVTEDGAAYAIPIGSRLLKDFDLAAAEGTIRSQAEQERYRRGVEKARDHGLNYAFIKEPELDPVHEEDMAADLADAVTQTVTEEAVVFVETDDKPVVDDGMPVTYADAETRRMAEKLAPRSLLREATQAPGGEPTDTEYKNRNVKMKPDSFA